ncbi:glycoside hydrolase family 1 protein [Streptococcus constellatus]|uniref:glycoside hydrolase family 1 protein n=1 Tax=Streptococcus constellatus TaxID=76860 RepID=UPI0020006055|nr:glycoside hydrolase family 1 protein [Streptococcus constellatus]
MTFLTFPKGFFWGTASSGPQTEGRFDGDGKGENIWDYWYNKEPEKFFNHIGPDKASYNYQYYKEDVQLMKATGHNSFRTSIQWSRLIPEGVGAVNPKAVDFYNSFIDELITNGIEPFINLYHFDMPMALQAKGGWLNRETVDAYVNFAKTCFDLFGDRVKYWFTHNEPIVPVEGGYLYNFHYPNEVNMKHAVQVAFHEMLASSLAVKAYHEKQDGKIGIILNLTPSYPRDENNPEDVKAAQIADAFFNRSFLDPAIKGEYPADKDPQNPMPDDFFDYYDMPGKKMNPYRGWEIYEKGIYDIMMNVRDNYGNLPCYISENGMGVEGEERYINANGQIEDDYRIEFVKNHLRYLHQAIHEGANCLGYHMWTCMDNWSWNNAYKNRYGLIAVDLDKQGKRTIKKSGYFFKELSDKNGFED